MCATCRYFPLIDAFQSTNGSIYDLADMIDSIKNCPDTSLLGTFSENHDQPRFASLNGDIAAAKNVLAFTMLTDGIPIVYQGQEQHYNAEGGSSTPYNREAIWLSGYNTDAELYQLVTSLNAIRHNAILCTEWGRLDGGSCSCRPFNILMRRVSLGTRHFSCTSAPGWVMPTFGGLGQRRLH